MDNIKLNLCHVKKGLKYDMITCYHPESVIQIRIQSLTVGREKKNSLQIVAVNIFVYFKTCWSFREGTIRHIFVSFVVINNICK